MDNNYEVPVVEEDAAEVTGGKGLAITALVFSILGLIPCLSLCGLAPIVGFILALVSRSKNGGKFSGMAKTALILAIVAFALAIIGSIVGLLMGLPGFVMSMAAGSY